MAAARDLFPSRWQEGKYTLAFWRAIQPPFQSFQIDPAIVKSPQLII